MELEHILGVGAPLLLLAAGAPNHRNSFLWGYRGSDRAAGGGGNGRRGLSRPPGAGGSPKSSRPELSSLASGSMMIEHEGLHLPRPSLLGTHTRTCGRGCTQSIL